MALSFWQLDIIDIVFISRISIYELILFDKVGKDFEQGQIDRLVSLLVLQFAQNRDDMVKCWYSISTFAFL